MAPKRDFASSITKCRPEANFGPEVIAVHKLWFTPVKKSDEMI
jgi:hypothetical protein